MIEVQHLNLAFGEGEKRNQVLYDVSFHVKPGEIYGLVGESGSGKTTVLKCLAGLFTHWQGELTIDAQPLGHEISRERCRQVQMVFQDPYGSLHPFTPLAISSKSRCRSIVSTTATGGSICYWIKLASTAPFASAIRISSPAGSGSAWR